MKGTPSKLSIQFFWKSVKIRFSVDTNSAIRRRPMQFLLDQVLIGIRMSARILYSVKLKTNARQVQVEIWRAWALSIVCVFLLSLLISRWLKLFIIPLRIKLHPWVILPHENLVHTVLSQSYLTYIKKIYICKWESSDAAHKILAIEATLMIK